MRLFCLEVTLVEDDTVTPVGEREEGETEGDAERKASEKELKEELESVDVGDTSSLLETLDTSVTMMVRESRPPRLAPDLPLFV